MSEENISQKFRLKNIYETRNYLIKEINQNELMSKNHKKVCREFNYTEHLLILISTVTVNGVSISAFASLVDIPKEITSSAIGLKYLGITKTYKSIIKKKEKKHVKIILLAKSKSNSIEVFN